MAPSPGQPLQSSLSGGQGGAKNLPVTDCSDNGKTTNENEHGNTQDITSRPGTPSGKHDYTYEPYEIHRNKKRSNYKQKRNEMEIFVNERYDYSRFFNIAAENGRNLAEIDVIKGNRQLIQHLKGEPSNVTEMKNGKLLVEVKNRQQSNDIMKLKSLDGCEVRVEVHDKLNRVKGTIYYQNRPNYTDEQLLKELERFDVIEIYRTKRKMNNILINSDIYIITFRNNYIPIEINIGWTKCKVREYIPRPRRCFKCQKFGHGSRTCRSETDICVNCGGDRGKNHQQPCTEETKCANCGQNHQASSMRCSKYLIEAEIISTQVKEKLRYIEAKRKVMARMPLQEQTFASTIKQSRKEVNNNEDNMDKNSENKQTEYCEEKDSVEDVRGGEDRRENNPKISSLPLNSHYDEKSTVSGPSSSTERYTRTVKTRNLDESQDIDSTERLNPTHNNSEEQHQQTNVRKRNLSDPGSPPAARKSNRWPMPTYMPSYLPKASNPPTNKIKQKSNSGDKIKTKK